MYILRLTEKLGSIERHTCPAPPELLNSLATKMLTFLAKL